MARKFFVGGVSLPNPFSFRSNHPVCRISKWVLLPCVQYSDSINRWLARQYQVSCRNNQLFKDWPRRWSRHCSACNLPAPCPRAPDKPQRQSCGTECFQQISRRLHWWNFVQWPWSRRLLTILGQISSKMPTSIMLSYSSSPWPVKLIQHCAAWSFWTKNNPRWIWSGSLNPFFLQADADLSYSSSLPKLNLPFPKAWVLYSVSVNLLRLEKPTTPSRKPLHRYSITHDHQIH